MSNKLKVMIFDLETSANLGYTWGMYEQNVIAFKKEWELLSFAYKILDEKSVHCSTRLDFKDKTDKSLVREMKRVLESADILIAHNGDEFDFKKANAKFIEHGLGPLSDKKKIDTKKVAKKYFKFNSNSLDNLGNLLGVGRKEKTGGFDLWLDCMAGKKAAFQKMASYNKQDVLLLERVYLKMRPWMEQHPNVNTSEVRACPKCGGTRLKSHGIRRTKVGQYRRYACLKCGGYCQARIAEKRNKPEIV
jgi:DNA polymerase elongation subunit (family B)